MRCGTSKCSYSKKLIIVLFDFIVTYLLIIETKTSPYQAKTSYACTLEDSPLFFFFFVNLYNSEGFKKVPCWGCDRQQLTLWLPSGKLCKACSLLSLKRVGGCIQFSIVPSKAVGLAKIRSSLSNHC